jgi:Fe-S cluster assembly ATP-binding protein
MDPVPVLEIDDLHAQTAGVEILEGVSLRVMPGEIHALMGPNASGKSTLAKTLLHSPTYEVTSGRILLKGEDITALPTEERFARGLFLGFQHPEEFPGVSVLNFLRQSLSARKGFEMSVLEVRLALLDWMKRLSIDPRFAERYLNDGFSGGEKKRSEVLQMALMEPDVAVLDETDSGLDIDALNTVSHGVNTVAAETGMGALIITHYQRILHLVKPEFVHIMFEGRIVKEGGPELVEQLEQRGYGWIRDEVAAAA